MLEHVFVLYINALLVLAQLRDPQNKSVSFHVKFQCYFTLIRYELYTKIFP